MVLIDPTKEPSERSRSVEKGLAPRRFTSLDGLRIGLVSNSKLNADKILLAIGDLLAERYSLELITHERKGNFSLPAPKEVVDRILETSDVVIAGVGD
jgi:hypothetical protein